MKKNILLGLFTSLLFPTISYCQNWQLGGNASPPLNNANNILGTLGNFSLKMTTTGIQRMVINPNLTSATTVAATPQNKDGFIGINTTDPWSRLHILNGTNAICAGYRAWMKKK